VTNVDHELVAWRRLVEDAVNAELDRLTALAADQPALLNELSALSVVVIDEAPTEEPDLLGIYHGVPVTESADRSGQLPPLVQIFLMPLVDLATPYEFDHLDPDIEILRRETVITVRHEIAHHFGMDHEHLEVLGLA
jgi:predicted Zn-dependent protease with MMP-like domain